VGQKALRADPDAEFLASTDNWFRPVQFANAPDGTLYVLDMYRQLIEGAAFLAPPILRHMDVSAGADPLTAFAWRPPAATRWQRRWNAVGIARHGQLCGMRRPVAPSGALHRTGSRTGARPDRGP
ncbi:MAG TPA: hypothetical protein PKD29_11655, partial [Rhodocyclaceae bacterium]|nr:hypothetical protein [Rhodocyclaceae bacterium]